jgi:hypothetical protein
MTMILIINSTATHFLAKAAYLKDVRPWERGSKRMETDPFSESNDSGAACDQEAERPMG